MGDGERSAGEVDHRTLADVGEAGLLRAIFPLLPSGDHTLVGPGDDTAVVAAPDGRVVATTDVLVEGRDFRHDWSTPQDVGAKAAAQNLADVAAMGAEPTALLVGLVAPADLPLAWAVGLSEGLAAGCAGSGAGVVGGDLSSGPVIVVSVTALGNLAGRRPVLRSGARPGDVVALAGTLGWSAAGLALLQSGWPDAGALAGQGPARPGHDLAAGAHPAELVAVHRRPTPPYAAGPAAARAQASAMLDVSDGLLRDAGRIAEASGVVLDLSRDLLAGYAAALRPVAAALGADPWEWVLSGGEDHGLLATFAPGAVPTSFTVVGVVRDGDDPTVLLDGGHPDSAVGWDHFRP